MTDPPAGGDDDLVAQFSDPALRHGYAEYPTGEFFPVPADVGREGRLSRRRLLVVVIIAIILAVAAGLVVGLAH
jgi:hypothetical protein